MKTQTNFKLMAAVLALSFGQAAWSQDPAPAKPAAAESKAQSSATAGQAEKPAVTPHNHMRDSKGMWVPPKKARKDTRKKDAQGAKASASAEAGNTR